MGAGPTSPTDAVGAKRFQKTFQLDGEGDMQVVVESTLLEEDVQDFEDEEEGTYVVNPFKSIAIPLAPASNRRRWSHLLPVFDGEGLEELNMKSLSIPAILPLTCDYFPSSADRTKHFVNYFYSLSVHAAGIRPEFLLKELISQRLAQDFQQVLTSIRGIPYSISNLPTIQTAAQIESGVLKFHLSMADECHIITYDPDLGNIEVERYVRRGRTGNNTHQQVSIPYRYFLWNDYVKKFYAVDIEIASHHHDYNWNFVDQLLCGFHETFLPGLKHRRKRFVIIPPEEKGEGKTVEGDCVVLQFMELILGIGFDKLHVKKSEQCKLLREFDSEQPGADEEGRTRQGFGLIGAKTIGIRVDLQSPRTDRQEWAMLQCDECYSPDAAYHYEVHWLAASGFAVDQFLVECSRKAKFLGLAVVEIPADHPPRSSDPFHLGVKFPFSSREQCKIAQKELLKSFDFVPDGAESSVRQYIHKTGVVLVRELADGLLWITNTLPSGDSSAKHCASLFRSFRKFCSSC
eukprot:TRINITY_DN20445_c0_g1_i1.p1 TRINITY_DN20445_c0_g1~~TRINITY_DN20445_c0_g1_i1.p1  ORF type:complete len:546 (+),score=141.84 TRINITY_DN20445_c0_g1_i1:90-1640(+)